MLRIYYLKGQTPPIEDFNLYIFKEKTHKISLLLNSDFGGMHTTQFDMDVPKDIKLDLNYGKDFPELHTKIVDKLKEKKSSLFLFTGPPGTGKTTYIKYLSTLIEREFIYIPVGMAGALTNKEMLSFLLDKKGCIIILEDAEKVIRSRDENENSEVVSTLLNLSDGILGNVLNISFIATYNSERESVDKAFLRKGRLKFEHEFKILSLEDTNRLLQHLELPVSKEPMSLADIYNIEDNTGHIEKAKMAIGFGATLK